MLAVDQLLLGLAANPALPADVVDRLIATAGREVAEVLAQRDDLTREQVLELARCVPECADRLAWEGRLSAADVDPVAQPSATLALLDQGLGDPESARILARSAEADQRERLAACPGLPADVVESLAADPDERVLAELALWTTAAVATRLATHAHAMVRCGVAHNRAAPPQILAALLAGVGPPLAVCGLCDACRCDAHAIRQAALENPATPALAAAAFADHPSMLLRWAVAGRTDLPQETYELLAGDPIPGTRQTLTKNPALTDPLLRVLAEDDNHDVRRCLAENPRLPLDVLDHLAATTKIGPVLLPRIAAASAEEIEQLAGARNPVVRMLVAARRDLPAAVRDALAADRDAKVLSSLAPHPGLTESQLRSMADRHGARVHAKVAENPAAPPSLLEEIAAAAIPVRSTLRAIARHPNATAEALRICLTDVRARVIAAGHPAVDATTLRSLLDHSDEQVGEAAAANPALPPDAMRELVPAAQLP